MRPDAHASDGVLLALHDHEPVELPDAAVHVETCPDCQARLQHIRADAKLVRTALAALPMPSLDIEPLRQSLLQRRPVIHIPSRWRRPAIQVAVALALATAAAASVGPIRTLIVHRNAPSTVPVTPRDPQAIAPISRVGATISFAETGPEFTVSFDSIPARGDLEIDRGPGVEVSAQAETLADASGDPMVVLPHELRLRNSARSAATYRIMIPGSVEHVRVTVAGRVLFDGPFRRARISLASGRSK
jgi:hypothetical protein